jgi:ELWxxDGT repeat protein
VFNNHLYFRADDGINGTEPWISDGTIAGTSMLKDINPTGNSFPVGILEFFVDGDTIMYFNADDGVTGVELWKTNGTSAGTVMVKDINPGSANSYPQYGILFNGELYFDAGNDSVSRELFKSDGTAAGTALLKDIGQNLPNPSFPGSFKIYNNELYFTARPLNGEFWIHKTDGTANGTVVVNNQIVAYNGDPLHIYNNNMYFAGFPATNFWDRELYKCDGTSTGTSLVGTINTSGSSDPGEYTEFNGNLFFSAKTQNNNRELYKTDGTNILLVKDIFPGASGSNPFNLVASNNVLYFIADDSIHGQEIWTTDGTLSGTNLLVDLYLGAQSSTPRGLFILNNNLFFYANDGTQRGLWKIGLNTSVNQLPNLVTSIYPNPTNDYLHIDLASEAKIEIYTITGQIMNISSIKQNHRIDVSTYPTGMYFIKTPSSTHKFIKQ